MVPYLPEPGHKNEKKQQIKDFSLKSGDRLLKVVFMAFSIFENFKPDHHSTMMALYLKVYTEMIHEAIQ